MTSELLDTYFEIVLLFGLDFDSSVHEDLKDDVVGTFGREFSDDWDQEKNVINLFG